MIKSTYYRTNISNLIDDLKDLPHLSYSDESSLEQDQNEIINMMIDLIEEARYDEADNAELYEVIQEAEDLTLKQRIQLEEELNKELA